MEIINLTRDFDYLNLKSFSNIKLYMNKLLL